MIPEKDILRKNYNALIRELEVAGATFKGSRSFKCPFHDDRAPSGSIHQDAEGVWRFKCHGCSAGGDVFDVLSRSQNRKVEDLLREMRVSTPAKSFVELKSRRGYPSIEKLLEAAAKFDGVEKVEAHYKYTNPDTGNVDMVVVRLKKEGKKTFLQGRQSEVGFEWGAPEHPLPLYNRTRLRDAHTVLVVEGEKCVHAINNFMPPGHAVTTAPGGAGKDKAKNADWSPLSGKKVILWPDNDDVDPKMGYKQGPRYMQEVAAELDKLAEKPLSVDMIDPEMLGIPVKGDCVEYLQIYEPTGDREKSIAAVVCALKTVQRMSAPCSLEEHLKDTIAGKNLPLKFKWPLIHNLTRAVMPGTITLICGDPGSTKSYMLLEQMWVWHREGVKVALFELEEDEPYWLSRVLAQVDRNAKLDDREWVHSHPAEAMAAYDRHRTFIESFKRRMTTAPGTREKPMVSQDDLIEWARKQAEAGCRVIAIDPVTAASPARGTERSFTPDLKFLIELKLIARDYHCSILLVTHPKESINGKAKAPIDNLAGGKAYARFVQTILWLVKFEDPKTDRVEIEKGRIEHQTFMRVAKFVKTRNGKGGGLEVAVNFDPATLTMSELGLRCKDNTSQGEGDDSPPPFVGRFSANAPRVRAPQAIRDPFEDEE